MNGGNGKAVEIAKLGERIESIKEDITEMKGAEKDYGVKVSKEIKDLYDQNRYAIKSINEAYQKTLTDTKQALEPLTTKIDSVGKRVSSIEKRIYMINGGLIIIGIAIKYLG